MKVIHTVVIVVSAVFFLSSCKTEDNETSLCDNFRSAFAIKDRMGQAVSIFNAGEIITFEASVTNNSDKSQKLTNSNGCQHVSIEVANGANQVVWSSASGVFCTDAVTEIEYAPGETANYSAQWNQTLNDNTQAPVGQYRANLVDKAQCSATLNKSGNFQLQ